jgi:hypothetical protein
MISAGPPYCLSIGQEVGHGVGTDTSVQIGNQRYQAWHHKKGKQFYPWSRKTLIQKKRDFGYSS